MHSETPIGHSHWTLSRIFRTYRGRLIVTYLLFNIENLLALAQLYVLGLAINGLLEQNYWGLGLLAVQHFAFLLVATLRRTYDTRAYNSITTEVATDLVSAQREHEIDVSAVTARSGMSHELVNFFEMDIPLIFQAFYSILGALVMLAIFDLWLVPMCLFLLIPLTFLNRVYLRKTLAINVQFNDELEREVDIITGADRGQIREHYGFLARCRIRLSDWEAGNFSLMELSVLGLIIGALVRVCSLPGISAGEIFSVLSYVLMFVSGLDVIPHLLEQAGRLYDIGKRVRLPDDEGESTEELGGVSVPAEVIS